MPNNLPWDSVIEVIRDVEEFTLAAHVLPDGDAVGATVGLGLILKKLKKKVYLPWSNEHLYVPAHLRFLPGLDMFKPAGDCPPRCECFIALDCGNAERLGHVKACFTGAKRTVNIDHHRDNANFAQINLVDETSAATSELVYTLARKMAVELDKDVATCLYTGIVTDTGRFQYPSTSADTLRIAAELVSYGVDFHHIFRQVYENQSFGVVKLFGRVLARAEQVPDIGVVHATVTEDDLTETGVKLEDTENLIDYLRATEGVEVAVVFKTVDRVVRVSMRSTGKVDVGRIAEENGGGGHPLAAGYNSRRDLAETKQGLFKRIREWVKE